MLPSSTNDSADLEMDSEAEGLESAVRQASSTQHKFLIWFTVRSTLSVQPTSSLGRFGNAVELKLIDP